MLIDLLFLYFIVMTIRRSRKEAPIGVYLALYTVVVMLWPQIWADPRFIVPIIPLAIYAFYWSVRDLLGKIPVPRQITYWAPFAVVATVLCANAARSAATQIDHLPYHAAWRNYFESADWVRYNTPQDALIVCRKPFLM